MMGHGKVFVIDEAELLDRRGQNALLKTLEEPPAQTYLILVTSSEDKLELTVRSRCQRVGFVSLGDEVVRTWVEGRAHGLGAAEVEWLITFADGSLGRAELGMEYGLYAWVAEIVGALDGMARGEGELGLGGKLAKMIDDFASRWVKENANASKEAANRRAAGLAWSIIARHARRRLAEAGSAASESDVDAAQSLVGPWLGVISALGVAERQLDRSLNLGLVCDHLVSLLARALSGRAVSDLVM
jgi:DNA polymerase-3 subunit delta'